jgi:transglutaminase-like putative cysteine protease
MDEATYLLPGEFVDSASPTVVDYARETAKSGGDDRERVVLLYETIRDGILYDPYVDFLDPANYRASGVLAKGRGFCVGKATLLSACARAVGVPARVGYADVRNHLTSPQLQAVLKTDLFIWHSYSELYLGGRWVKATPAFNKSLCERLGLHPLEFDGSADSLFHPFDRTGRRHMEYVLDRGSYADTPCKQIMTDFTAYYPGLRNFGSRVGDFQKEAVAGDA